MNDLITVLPSTALVLDHPFAIDLNQLSDSDKVRIGTVWIKLSENTRRTYHSAHQRCGDWLLAHGVPSLDMLTDELLSLYIRQLDTDGIAPQSIPLAVSPVKWFFDNVRSETRSWKTTENRLGAIRRDSAGRVRGQVKGLEWRDVQRICAVAEADGTITGLRDSAADERLLAPCLGSRRGQRRGYRQGAQDTAVQSRSAGQRCCRLDRWAHAHNH